MRRLVRGARKWTRCGSTQQVCDQLRRWYDTWLGSQFHAEEGKQLAQLLPNLFGYYLLQIGVHAAPSYLNASRVRYHLLMDCAGRVAQSGEINTDKTPGFVRCGPEQLAIATDSQDLVLLSHVLEFSEHPHEVLREVDRILIPEGHAVILVFNPWSLWGLWRLVLGWRNKAPWCGKFIGSVRLRDWLQLLGFEVLQTKGYFYRPPIGRTSVLQKLSFLERLGARCWPILSGGYFILAKKRVSTLTPIKPRWRPRRSGLVTPIASNTSVTNRNDS